MIRRIVKIWLLNSCMFRSDFEMVKNHFLVILPFQTYSQTCLRSFEMVRITFIMFEPTPEHALIIHSKST